MLKVINYKIQPQINLELQQKSLQIGVIYQPNIKLILNPN